MQRIGVLSLKIPQYEQGYLGESKNLRPQFENAIYENIIKQYFGPIFQKH